MTVTTASTSAAERWRALVQARLAELAELDPERGTIGAAFWDTRARRYAARTAGTGEKDPFLRAVRCHVRRRTTVVDVGAGPGRLALPLAATAEQVTAVDPSAQMLAILRREARRRGLANVRTVHGRWEDVAVEPADVAICSYVLPMIEDAAGFLRKLDAAARRRAFVYLSAVTSDLLTDPLWRHFHGRPRRPGPTYLDAVAVLAELGIRAVVGVVEVPVRARFTSLRQAVSEYRDYLALPDSAEARRELRGLLADWLVGPPDALRAPVRTLPGAVLSWVPRSLGDGGPGSG